MCIYNIRAKTNVTLSVFPSPPPPSHPLGYIKHFSTDLSFGCDREQVWFRLTLQYFIELFVIVWSLYMVNRIL